MTRTPLMAGNWKMNLDHLEAISLVQKLALTLKDLKHDYATTEAAVIVPFTDIRSVQTLVESEEFEIGYGAQDVSIHDKGAFTGEISTGMLTKLGCTYVVVGHSERREYHGETSELVGKKAKKVLDAGMTPIMCCGEALDVRKAANQVDLCSARSRRCSRVSPLRRWPSRSSPTSPFGPLAPVRSPPRRTPRKSAARSASRWANFTTTPRRRPFVSSTAAR